MSIKRHTEVIVITVREVVVVEVVVVAPTADLQKMMMMKMEVVIRVS